MGGPRRDRESRQQPTGSSSGGRATARLPPRKRRILDRRSPLASSSSAVQRLTVRFGCARAPDIRKPAPQDRLPSTSPPPPLRVATALEHLLPGLSARTRRVTCRAVGEPGHPKRVTRPTGPNPFAGRPVGSDAGVSRGHWRATRARRAVTRRRACATGFSRASEPCARRYRAASRSGRSRDARRAGAAPRAHGR